jgi:hypothetical protein
MDAASDLARNVRGQVSDARIGVGLISVQEGGHPNPGDRADTGVAYLLVI